MLHHIHKEKISKKYSSNDRFNRFLTNVKKSNKKKVRKMGLTWKSVPLESIKDRMIVLSDLHRDNIT